MLFRDGDSGKIYFSIVAGKVSLKLHNRKDIFYAEDVSAHEAMPDYEELIGIEKVGFDEGGFSTEGTKIEFHKVDIESKDTIIEGFYLDTMPVNQLIPYQIKIYIRYETEEES